ncbi:hypothetical protein PVK06_001289 [Gossypium arboreum]|uniref:Uncharacterized protein n=1 Tax=Gossypium arboreum TaxID=29729 RepID=A0ABR0R0V3_GOSAR|nr:hypothetical protein PVK06_001289 [Gossypium arboreum]
MRKSFKDSLKALEANIHFTNTLKGFQFQAALYNCNVAGTPAVVTRGLYPVETISTVGKICAKDYLAAPSTADQSYIVILEHTIAERERSDHSAYVQDMSAHNFLEVGAAALLVGDMEAKMNGQPWKYFGTACLILINSYSLHQSQQLPILLLLASI